MVATVPGYGPIDPQAPILRAKNLNGDLVFRNVRLPLQQWGPARDNEFFYMHSLVISCMASNFPPPDATSSLQCYVPYGPHHTYRGRIAHTKSGKICKVSAWVKHHPSTHTPSRNQP
eukprot:2146960-Pyramimonas_sp.AAC.1